MNILPSFEAKKRAKVTFFIKKLQHHKIYLYLCTQNTLNKQKTITYNNEKN